jgi:tetratricopeptide (TPR) repeat protein
VRTILSLLALSLTVGCAARAELTSVQNPQPPATVAVASRAPAVDTPYEKGNRLLESGDYLGAHAAYKECGAKPACIFGSGVAAFEAKDYGAAIAAFKQSKALDPKDWTVRARLVQVYQAIGDKAARDAERTELLALRDSVPALKARDSYPRDAFDAGGERVAALEHFDRASLKYSFVTMTRHISLKSDGKAHLLMMGDAVMATFEGAEPDYDEVRQLAISALEGKLKGLPR